MASVVEEANAYFPSISSLAARVFADVELVKQAGVASGEWEELSVEEQELITDQVLIDSQVLERTAENDQYPDCFPVLKVKSGEKIVVDFENDDSCTWTDEHSAPFSWRTKSQQDLSLDDLDDSCVSKAEQVKSRFTKRLRSPDRSVWDTSFFPGGDKKNEIEKMFEKFKIKMAADDENADDENADDGDNPKMDGKLAPTMGVSDSDFSPAHSEHSKLIGDVNKAFTSSVDDVKHTATVTETKQDAEKARGKKHKHKKDKHDKVKKSRHGKSQSKHAAEPDSAAVIPTGSQSVQQSAIPPPDDNVLITTIHQTSSDDVHSSVSQQLEAQLGLPSVHTSCHVNAVFSDSLGETNMDDVGSVDVNPLDCSTAELILEMPTREVDNVSKSGTLKSGFEFLDEW